MAAVRIQSATNGDTGVAAIIVGSGQGWATPTAGRLIVAWYNGDNTCATPTGFTAGPSIIDGNACYFWWKIAAGTESSVTFTQAGSTDGTCGLIEYSGVSATPTDVQNTSTLTSSGSTTTSVSITVTGTSGDLVVAQAGLHGTYGSSVQPTAPVWTNSYSNFVSFGNGAYSTASACHTFIAELLSVSAGATSTACSWSSTTASARQELLISFKLSASVANPAIAFAPKRRRVGSPPRELARQGRVFTPIREQVNPPFIPSVPKRSATPRRFALARIDGGAFSPPLGVTAPPVNPPITATVFGRLRTIGRIQPRPRVNDPVPAQVTLAYYRMYEFSSPPTTAASDPSQVSVGVEFYVTVPATLTEIRWWQATTGADLSSRTGALFLASGGGALTSTAATAVSGTGWQTLTFASPVALTPNTRYKAAVYHPGGQYTSTPFYYTPGPDEVNGPLVFPRASNTVLGQDTFNYATGISYPASTFNDSNYWVDVTVTTTSFLGTWLPFLARRRVFGKIRTPARAATPVPAQVIVSTSPAITATTTARTRRASAVYRRRAVTSAPLAGSGAPQSATTRRRLSILSGKRRASPSPLPAQAAPPISGRLRSVGRTVRRGEISTPVTPQTTPAVNPPITATVFGRLRTIGRIQPRARVNNPTQGQQPLAPNPPITATVFGRLRTIGRIQPRGKTSKPIPPQVNPPIGQTVFARLRTIGRVQPRPRIDNPTQGQQPLAPNPPITATVFGRLRTVGRVRPRTKVSSPIPGQPQVPNPPITATVFGRLRTVGRVRPRTKAVTPVQPQTDLPNPVFKRLRTVGRTNRIPRVSKPIPPQANPLYPVRPSVGGLSGLRRVWLKIRRKNAYPVPPQVTTLSGPITITDSHGGVEAGRSSGTIIGGTYRSTANSTVSKGSSGGVTADPDNDNVAPTYDSDSDSL